MICPTELQLMTHADGASRGSLATEIEAHAVSCTACRQRLDALVAERRVLAAALAMEPEALVVPEFRAPQSRRVLGTVAAIVLLGTLVIDVVPALLTRFVAGLGPDALAWFDLFDTGTLVTLSLRAAMFIAEHGDDIMSSIAFSAGGAVILAVLGSAAWALRRRRTGPLLLLVLMTAATAALPERAEALEIRRADGGHVFVAADESIDDTLIAYGETVEVDGHVTGDLVAVGRQVAIRGRVDGQVFAAGESVNIDGEVGGSAIGAGETVSVSARRIGRNVYGAGETLSITAASRVEQNVIVAGERATVAAPVGRDLFGAAETLEVNSEIGGDVTAYAARIALLGETRVAGDVTTHGLEADHLTISPGAVVGGEVKSEVRELEKEGSRYGTLDFYLFQLLRFAAAFVTGAIALALLPRLRRVAFDTVPGTLTAAAVGVVALVSAPFIALLAAITVVGLPVGLAGFVLWAGAVYLAKVVVAHSIGERLLAGSAGGSVHFVAALALGLAIVIVIVNVPFVGGVFNFVMTVAGLGALVLLAWRAVRGEIEPRTP